MDCTRPPHLTPRWRVSDKVVAFTTLRSGGVSEGDFASFNIGLHVGDQDNHVHENRRLLAAMMAEDVAVQWLNQVHGSTVIEAVGQAAPVTADAAFTVRPGVACCVTTADCLPVFIAARDGRAVAMAHAGWRGLAGGILESTVAALPAEPESLQVWLGPAIGPCHFEVGEEVLKFFVSGANAQARDSVAECFTPGARPGKFMADLYRLARLRLNHIGVTDIGGGDCCTCCDEDRFFSYRRNPRTGRLASLIYLKE